MYGHVAVLTEPPRPSSLPYFTPKARTNHVVVLTEPWLEPRVAGVGGGGSVRKVRVAMIATMSPMMTNPVFHIPISSPYFPSCSPVFEKGLELNVSPAQWPDCFAFRSWCCIRFDSTYEVDVDLLSEIRIPARPDAGQGIGPPLALQRGSAERLRQRITERQRLQEKRALAASVHLDSFMARLDEEAALVVERSEDEKVSKTDGPSPGPGLGPSRAVLRSSGTADGDARSVLSSRASVSLSSDADTLVDKDKLSSKWSLGSLFAGSRRSSIISTAEERSAHKDIELPDWKHD